MKIFNGQQYKTISIIGSFKKQMDDIQRAKKVFLNKGFKVLAPASTTISGEKKYHLFCWTQTIQINHLEN